MALLTRAEIRMTLQRVTDPELAMIATACDLTMMALAGVRWPSTLTRAMQAVRDGVTHEQKWRRSGHLCDDPAAVGAAIAATAAVVGPAILDALS